MKFRKCIGICFNWPYWCIFVTDGILTIFKPLKIGHLIPLLHLKWYGTWHFVWPTLFWATLGVTNSMWLLLQWTLGVVRWMCNSIQIEAHLVPCCAVHVCQNFWSFMHILSWFQFIWIIFANCIISLVIKFQIIICGCRYWKKSKDLIHLPHGCWMVWFYFGNGHGKGVHDGVGAMLKQEIHKEQLIMDSERL
jgi:hypothetical protein